MSSNEIKITPQQVQVHKKQQDPDAEAKTRESDFDAVARALLQNYSGVKGSGENIYIETSAGKKTAKDVSVWMQSLDTNKDGIITEDEVKKAGGDKFDILKMNADEKTREKISKDMESERLIGGMETMAKGIDTGRAAWLVAKPLVMKYTNKTNLKKMFSDEKVMQHYNKNYWGTTPEQVKDKKLVREHMKEVFASRNFTEQDFKEMGFSSEQIQFFLQK